MLRGMIKEVACSIPTVRRVFEQRDTAMAQAEAARRQLQDAQREAAELSSELSALTGGGVEGSAQEVLPEYSKAGFSHWGEDFIVEFIFSSVMDGRYLDIGCFHPALYSNTMRLYRKGWSGVNVDPNPFMIKQCLAMRPRDVSLNKAVGKEHGSIEYYSFHDWASSNTASPEFARVIAENQNLDMPVGKSVELVTLSEIMAEHFSDRTPEFVNIDVEDLDVDVLQSGDWSRYRPKVIAIEDIKFSSDAPDDSAIYRFLKAQGYRMFSRCVYTSFFIEKDFNANSFQFP
ncbi:FkbM family methyltransferase [Caballeronia sp. LZ029]|uniref:FkbM family methyltransferase n=1 Tax=Caballeronia sp. LZ029 TaxID=3038564 RepID=UPI002865C19E|nr:FkbM family methyltransferase [Caballeronia sp. LZ029]MDR5743734.1 FkbM family methyltransferase [Caballeronia sp. LZ029]